MASLAEIAFAERPAGTLHHLTRLFERRGSESPGARDWASGAWETGGSSTAKAGIRSARSESGGPTMLEYRMYFRIAGQIHGRDDFEANSDVAAIRIARVLYEACSDVCESFELWQGTRRLRARQAHCWKANLADLIEAHQRVVIEREECISHSEWMIARSQRLIEALDRAAARGGIYHQLSRHRLDPIVRHKFCEMTASRRIGFACTP